MNRYQVEVDQTLTYKFTVQAETPEEAKEVAEDRVRYGHEGVMFEHYETDVAQVFELRKRFP